MPASLQTFWSISMFRRDTTPTKTTPLHSFSYHIVKLFLLDPVTMHCLTLQNVQGLNEFPRSLT